MAPTKALIPFLDGALMWSVQNKRVLEVIFGTQARKSKSQKTARYSTSRNWCHHLHSSIDYPASFPRHTSLYWELIRRTLLVGLSYQFTIAYIFKCLLSI